MLSETRRPQSGSKRVERAAATGRCGAALLAIAVGVAGCSSESLPEPQPEVQHAGAFVAVGETELALYRTLKAIRIEGDTFMFMTLYDIVPEDFERARAIAKQTSIPIRQEVVTVSRLLITQRRHEVVWFRTLTKEEEARSP